MLKKINSDTRYSENKESYLERLNRLDSSLNIFMHSGKDILNSLHEEHVNIIGEDNQRQQEAVNRYADAVYKSINSRSRDIENNQELERGIIEAFSLEEEIEEQFVEIRELIIESALLVNTDSQRSQIVQRVYRRIRKIPLYLGSPYRERYLLYNKLQKYPKSHDIKHEMLHDSQYDTYKIVNMLMVGSSYDSYYKRKYQDILDYIEKVQKDACSSDTIEFKDKFDEAIFNLNKLIKNSTKKVKDKYSKLDGGCFSIIDLYLKNGMVNNYICFSGIFDLDCFQNKFIINHNNALMDAIRAIANSSEFLNAELVTSNRYVRYYYGANNAYLTLCDVCNSVNSGHEKRGGMFSCCERKFYTKLEQFDVSDVDKYKMFTKYNACPMCEDAINDFRLAGYVDTIIFGKPKGYGPDYKTIYDKLAKDISNGNTGINL